MIQLFVSKVLLPVANLGASENDGEELRFRKSIAVTSVLLGGIPVQIGFGLLFLFFNEPATGWVLICSGLLMLLGVLTFSITRQFHIHSTFWLFITVMSPFISCLLLGGFAASGFVIIWALLAPLIALITNRPRYALIWFLIFVSTLIISAFAQPYLRITNNLSSSFILTYSVSNITSATALFLIALYYFVSQNSVLIGLLRKEQQKSDSLLHNILPKEIADILKNGNRIIADQVDSASVLFADMVNSTPMSVEMSPTNMVLLLNEIFSHFDTLVEKYELEKIKTIGDCYMVAAGVPRPLENHAKILTQLALDMHAYIKNQTFKASRPIDFKIGISSGPVLAGVIGRKKFIYDLWGDTVNTASRMESHGAGGIIQITAATYELIKDEFICEERGLINVKGKGEMPVWYVLERNKKICVNHET